MWLEAEVQARLDAERAAAETARREDEEQAQRWLEAKARTQSAPASSMRMQSFLPRRQTLITRYFLNDHLDIELGCMFIPQTKTICILF